MLHHQSGFHFFLQAVKTMIFHFSSGRGTGKERACWGEAGREIECEGGALRGYFNITEALLAWVRNPAQDLLLESKAYASEISCFCSVSFLSILGMHRAGSSHSIFYLLNSTNYERPPAPSQLTPNCFVLSITSNLHFWGRERIGKFFMSLEDRS